MVSAGGDSRVIGDRRGRPWSIGVRDPRHPDRVVAMLPLEDVSISTSGDYERFFESDGVRFITCSIRRPANRRPEYKA